MLRDPVLEQRARAISAELRCLVCQNQSIDDSDADLARDLRQAAASDAAITIVDRYLDDAGIAAELLAEPSARVTAEQYVALFRSLTDRRDDDMLGFVSRPLRRGSMALVFRSAISAGTLVCQPELGHRPHHLLHVDRILAAPVDQIRELGRDDVTFDLLLGEDVFSLFLRVVRG